MLAFLKAVETNILPSGRTINVGKTDLATLRADFISNSLSSPQRVTKKSRNTRNPSTYMFEAIGSYTNRNALFLVSRSLNARKGLIFGTLQLVDEVLYTNFVKTAVQTGVGEEKILQPLREVCESEAGFGRYQEVEC